MIPGPGILTLACGARRYLAMAEALIRSIRLRDPDIPIAVVTDAADPALKRLRSLSALIVRADPALGRGVEQKLHLDSYSPFAETLFIDADCLVFRPLQPTWEKYREARGFGVISYGELREGDTHPAIRDFPGFLKAAEIDSLPAFNGGIYYFDRSPAARKVFETARQLFERRNELGLEKFKNAAAADEPIFAVAMRLAGVAPLAWDGSATMGTVLDCFQTISGIDVLQGRSTFEKLGHIISPAVIHFNMNAQHSRYYLRECWRLRLAGLPAAGFVAGALGALTAAQRRIRAAFRRRFPTTLLRP